MTCRALDMIPAIIPYYKKTSQLVRCLSHLEAQTVPVDIFIRNNDEDNVYFTAAINEGIKQYLGQACQYLLVLNQDMYLEPTAVERMTEFMDSHPRCGIGAPLQLHSRNPAYVIFAGGRQAFPMGKHTCGDLKAFTKDQQIPWANGACMILRKEMIQEIGLWDQNYVLIGSDSDYSFTARSRGWQVWRIASAKGIHEQGATGRLCDRNIEFIKIKDMIYFGQKWLTGDLYKKLSYEDELFGPDEIEDTMSQLHETRTELERSFEQAIR